MNAATWAPSVTYGLHALVEAYDTREWPHFMHIYGLLSPVLADLAPTAEERSEHAAFVEHCDHHAKSLRILFDTSFQTLDEKLRLESGEDSPLKHALEDALTYLTPLSFEAQMFALHVIA